MGENSGTSGTKEINKDYDEFGNIGKTMNLVAVEGSNVSKREKVLI